MTRKQFINLRIGDSVIVIARGKNKGKQAIVTDIIRGPDVIHLDIFAFYSHKGISYRAVGLLDAIEKGEY